MSNWYNNEEYATIEIATLVGDVYFENYENITGNFIIQILTPEEPIVNKVVKNQNPAPHVQSIKSKNKLESRPYVVSNAMNLVIPAYVLVNFTINPEDQEEGIYKIPSGTKFIISVLGGDIATQDIRIISAYSEEESAKSGSGTRTSGTNKAGANNRNSNASGGTRTSGK